MSDVIHHDGFKRYSSGFGAENEGFGMEVTMLAIMIMGYIGRYFITISAYVLADGIREDLGMREGEYENLVSTGFVFELIGTLVAGIVADRVDPRLTYLVSQYLVVLSALLLAWSQTLWQFQLGWYFIALIQCGTWGSTVKIVSKWTPFERQGRSMAAASFSVGAICLKCYTDFLSMLVPFRGPHCTHWGGHNDSTATVLASLFSGL